MKHRPRSDEGNRWVFYYDADCRFCAKVTSWLSRIDFSSRITWTPSQALDKPPAGLTWDDLKRAAFLEDRLSGRSYEGFFAFRMLTFKMPALALLFPLFWFPAISFVGVAVYRWIARNRYRIAHCADPKYPRVK
mgnify:CR=1 FL=1